MTTTADFWRAMAVAFVRSTDHEGSYSPTVFARAVRTFADAATREAAEAGMLVAAPTGGERRVALPWGGSVNPTALAGLSLDPTDHLLMQFGRREAYVRSPDDWPLDRLEAVAEVLIERGGLHRLPWPCAGVRLHRIDAATVQRNAVAIQLHGGGFLRSPPLADPTAVLRELDDAMRRADLVEVVDALA